MPHLDRRLVAALCLLAFAAALLVDRPGGSPAAQGTSTGGAGSSWASGPSSGASGPAAVAAGPVVVDVVGAVRRPGVYRLRPGARLLDALRAAGGARPRADLAAINMAARAVDGQQIAVPQVGAAPAAASAPNPGAGASAAAPVSLSSADAAALDALPGIGPATAQRIIDWRQAHGGFGSVDALLDVPGIGPAKLDALRGLVVP